VWHYGTLRGLLAYLYATYIAQRSQAQKTTAEVLRPDKSGLRMTGVQGFSGPQKTRASEVA
jgi:hypothetical protein